MKITILIIAFSLLCSAMGAQRFPYDIDASGSDDTVATHLNILVLKEHIKVFGTDSVSVEVYFQERKLTKRPSTSLMDFGTECTGNTYFLAKAFARGQFPFIIGQRPGLYTFIFNRGTCFFEIGIEYFPSGASSESYFKWGQCSVQAPIQRLIRL